MEIFPAIDILSGKVVRLKQGDYNKTEVFGENPYDMASYFYDLGATNLHIVDLDGAKDGSPKNFSVIERIALSLPMTIECGGGIRNEETVERYLNSGISRVILGTLALKDKEFTKEMLRIYSERVAIGIDARNNMVAVEGWTSVSEIDSISFSKEMKTLGAKYIIYTDIAKDGEGKGTNLPVYETLSEIEGVFFTASGGISTLSEIEQLKKMGIYAVILGKAIYTGLIDLKEALKIN